MSGEGAVGLIGQAQALDAQAYRVGEDGPLGRELRAQAAALRLAALGPRSYPVLVCASCFRLTGWTSEAGDCHACTVHGARLAAQAQSRGWIDAGDVLPYAHPAGPQAAPLRARLAARVGRRGGLARAEVQAWMERVEPGESGPVEPEVGYEVESASRDEVERLDGLGLLVRFTSVTLRFAGGGWERLATTRIARAELPNPAEFAGDLPVATLVDAWSDYQQAVAAFNRAVWGAEADRRERERVAGQAHADALAEQRHVSDLLRE